MMRILNSAQMSRPAVSLLSKTPMAFCTTSVAPPLDGTPTFLATFRSATKTKRASERQLSVASVNTKRASSRRAPKAVLHEAESSDGTWRETVSSEPRQTEYGSRRVALALLSSAFTVSAVGQARGESEGSNGDGLEAIDADTETPGWLQPALLAFPLLTYAAFSVFREKVNPQASTLDFLFILVAVFIILNLFSILLLGIRLY
eukprot:TRINITY_DN30203_c0_g1_i1.p1 TRINITY_DN30203_c0_g1~~TRINITY_DN30203_c0_g1_i1.p1  ORF type:complete len:204 (+),score=28.11 TRINITY_DN30203_c0_g1_i1:120-731(+)